MNFDLVLFREILLSCRFFMKKLWAVLAVAVFAVSAQARPAVEGALAYYSFDDGNYVDGTTNGYDGYAYAGTPRFTNDVPPSVGGGKSMDLKGGNNAMGVADGGDFNPDTETVTVAFWMKGVPTDNWGHSISKGWGDSSGWAMRSRGEWNLGTAAAGRIRLLLQLGDMSKWNHWVLSYQSTSVGPGLHKAWRNGNEWTGSMTADGKITDVAQDFRIGFADGEYTKQQFDEVYIFDRLLTDAERLQLYEYVYPVPWSNPGTVLIVR